MSAADFFFKPFNHFFLRQSCAYFSIITVCIFHARNWCFICPHTITQLYLGKTNLSSTFGLLLSPFPIFMKSNTSNYFFFFRYFQICTIDWKWEKLNLSCVLEFITIICRTYNRYIYLSGYSFYDLRENMKFSYFLHLKNGYIKLFFF